MAHPSPTRPPRRQGLRPIKRLGQHLLVDPDIIDRLLGEADVQPTDAVLEIGPGTGAISAGLARAGRMVAVELDRRYAAQLAARFASRPNVTVLHRDILGIPAEEIRQLMHLEPPLQRRKVVANIPYYITGPILALLLNEDAFRSHPLSPDVPLFDEILIMVQKEVGERLLARPGTRAWGALSVKVQYATLVEPVMEVPRRAFRPSPQVDSLVVRLWPRRSPPVSVNDLSLFWRVVDAIFRTRRKTLRNSLRLAGLPFPGGWDERLRGETLDLENLATLSNRLGEMTHPGLA